jgi:hypothetical protein
MAQHFFSQEEIMEGTMKWETNFKPIVVKMSDDSRLDGKLNIRNFKRISDFFRNVQDQFIVMVTDEEQAQRTIILNRNFIVWIEAKS